MDLIKQESRINVGSQAFQNDEFVSKCLAERLVNCPFSTFYARRHGWPSRVEKHPTPCKLTEFEEKTLVHNILERVAIGQAPSLEDIREKVNILLAERGDDLPETADRD